MDKIHHQTKDDVLLINMQGEVTLDTVEQYKEDVFESIRSAENPVLVDMSAVSFMDSGAIGFLITLLKDTSKDKRLMAISGAEGQPRIVLRMVGIDEHVRIYKNVDEAITAMKAKDMK